MTKWVVLSPFMLLAMSCSPASAAPFYGTAQNIDGDSLTVGGKEVRLFGIDAPEFNQTCKRAGQDWPCGAEAADRLSRLVTGKDVRCVSMGVDVHNRILGRCTVDGTDINRTMVASGYAVAFRRYSTDYGSAEESAKLAKRGIWAGTFQMPQQYRDHEMVVDPPGRVNREGPVRYRPHAVANSGCSIKGNRGSHGWIYHLPGMPFYDRTNAEEMFCSEAAAQAAGYRRAKVR
jgi:endonuclease YncB( thermonuclease family)